MRPMLFLLMTAEHLLFGEWRWFRPMGLRAMWVGAGQAARAGRLA